MPARARRAERAAATDVYARQQQALTVDIVRQVAGVWQRIDPNDIDHAWPIVSRALTQTIERGYADSTAQAVAYLQRHAEAVGVDLGTAIRRAHPLNLTRIEAALNATGPAALKRAAGNGMDAARASSAALVQISGASSRLALAGGRGTIADTIDHAGQIVGYRRVISSHACYFCAMLASRGAVYKDAHSATFRGSAGRKYHDHCHCLPEPLYEHEAEPLEVKALQQLWNEHAEGTTAAEQIAAFRRAYDPATGGRLVDERVKPINARNLSTLGDDELAGLLADAADELDLEAIVTELDRRDAAAKATQLRDAHRAKRRQQAEARRDKNRAAKDAEFERRLDAGEDPEAAFADVYGVGIERQRRDTAIAALRHNGYQGNGFAALTADAYRDEVNRLYFVAEEQARGHLLNAAGRRAGIDPKTLFTGPEATARKYASDELLEFWHQHGRLTLDDFRANMLGGKMRERTAGEGFR